MSRPDKERWLGSKNVAAFLNMHRDNDIKVQIGSHSVPIRDVFYDNLTDTIFITLIDGEEMKDVWAGRSDLSALVNFQADIVAGLLTLVCDVCQWRCGLGAPYLLGELIEAATAHVRTCP